MLLIAKQSEPMPVGPKGKEPGPMQTTDARRPCTGVFSQEKEDSGTILSDWSRYSQIVFLAEGIQNDPAGNCLGKSLL